MEFEIEKNGCYTDTKIECLFLQTSKMTVIAVSENYTDKRRFPFEVKKSTNHEGKSSLLLLPLVMILHLLSTMLVPDCLVTSEK